MGIRRWMVNLVLIWLALVLIAAKNDAACVDPPDLPRIRATGTLGEALQQCGDGCRIELEPRIYANTNILIGQPWLAQPNNSDVIERSFPKGLVLQGQPGTELHSAVFRAGYERPVAVLRFDRQIFGTLVIRNLILDGLKDSQPDAKVSTSGWLGGGLVYWGAVVSPRAKVCVERVESRNHLMTGMGFSYASVAAVENLVRDVGCDAENGHACPEIPHYVEGYGFGFGEGVEDSIVTYLEVIGTTKYGWWIKGSGDGLTLGAKRIRADHINVHDVTHMSSFYAGMEDVEVVDSSFGPTISNVPMPPGHPGSENTAAVSCQANVRNFRLRNITMPSSSGAVFMWGCGGEVHQPSQENRIENVVADGACLTRKPPAYYLSAFAMQAGASGDLYRTNLTIKRSACVGDNGNHHPSRVQLLDERVFFGGCGPLDANGDGLLGVLDYVHWIRQIGKAC